ncbi:arsenicals resistance [Rhodotorula kratochvilovae]
MQLFRSLSWGDRLLAPLVLAAMILGVGLGNAIPQERLNRVFDAGTPGSASWEGVSIPLLVGLLLMIWPAMSKVQWEKMPILFKSRNIYLHLGISLVLNWIVAPFLMAACAWIALPEASMDRERRGVLLVGVGASRSVYSS